MTSKSPAVIAAERAITEVFGCIDQGTCFKLEAGAGAGKTTSLVRSLQYIIKSRGLELARKNQRVACITYTNGAKDVIIARTDGHPVVFAATIHAFCWELMKSFQPSMRSILVGLEKWKEAKWVERMQANGGIENLVVEYDLGHRSVKDGKLLLHHDDVIKIACELMSIAKFRKVLAARFPVLFIDEYQDTNQEFAQALVAHFVTTGTGPLIGLFGDGWQRIYNSGAHGITSENLRFIGKQANFRSAKDVVDSLNRLRPDLPQELSNPDNLGSVTVYHTNAWVGTRQSGSHSKGDLPASEAHRHLEELRNRLISEGWDFDPTKTKILMLTHAALGSEQGYGNLVKAYAGDNDAFVKKEDPHFKYFADTVEPLCEAYANGRFGEMMTLAGRQHIGIRSMKEKTEWNSAIGELIQRRMTGTVSDVLAEIVRSGKLNVPDAVLDRESELSAASAEDVEQSRHLKQLRALQGVPYSEVQAAAKFVNDHTPFATKHGVKGEEYDNVLVVFGRGWNHYDWNKFLESHMEPVPADKVDSYERNRNLFYVACSRAKERLVLLFTQELTPKALNRLSTVFGQSNVHSFVLS